MKLAQLLQEYVARRKLQHALHELGHRLLILAVGIHPAGVDLGFVQRLLHIAVDSSNIGFVLLRIHRIQRPSAHQRLIQKVLFVGVRRVTIGHAGLRGSIQIAPAANGAIPFSRSFRKHIDARSHVFTALGVVRGTGAHAIGPQLAPDQIAAMKRVHRYAKMPRIAAHFV